MKLVELSEGKKGDLGTATRSVNQAVERTRSNLNWMKKYLITLIESKALFPIYQKKIDLA